ncbi:MAG: Fic family protein [Planctomycetia bacterium]|nr:Fic family protein [Planctomycetia bacterium]
MNPDLEPIHLKFPLRMVFPQFDSTLTELILTLDHLRDKKSWESTMPPNMFSQVQDVFFLLESVATARIEGNHTTILEYVSSKINQPVTTSSGIQEILNLEATLSWVEETAKDREIPMRRMYVQELHRRLVQGLAWYPEGEGDSTPGEYRNVSVLIGSHKPVDFTQVPDYMEDLFDFLEEERPARMDLLKIALSHHRLVWIHPFQNGNGRTARLFTYALLVRYGFGLETGRLFNPASVFCATRETYYQKLAAADRAVPTGDDAPLLDWCEYVLAGIHRETEHLSQLTDYAFFSSKILRPAIRQTRQGGEITEREEKILLEAVAKKVLVPGDVREMFRFDAATVSRLIRGLRDKKMLVPTAPNARSYSLQFANNVLLRGVIRAMGQEGFLPIPNEP